MLTMIMSASGTSLLGEHIYVLNHLDFLRIMVMCVELLGTIWWIFYFFEDF